MSDFGPTLSSKGLLKAVNTSLLSLSGRTGQAKIWATGRRSLANSRLSQGVRLEHSVISRAAGARRASKVGPYLAGQNVRPTSRFGLGLAT